MRNGIDFSVTVSQDKLAELFEDAIDQALEGEPLEVNSVTVQMKRMGRMKISPHGKDVKLHLPYSIDLRRAAGLFSVEASGAIILEMNIAYDISEDLKIKSDTTLLRYGWLEKPKLEIGIINIPLEKIIDMVIQHYESLITGKIDSAIREKARVQAILKESIQKAHDKLAEIDTKGINIQARIDNIELVEPELDDSGDINLVGRIDTKVTVSDQELNLPYNLISYKWIDTYSSTTHALTADLYISYKYLADMALEMSQGKEIAGKEVKLSDVNIKLENNLIYIYAAMEEPIKATAKISAKPYYNETSGLLDLEEVDVKVKPSNIVYKLTVPLVNNFIENKIEEFFPLNVNELLKSQIASNIPGSMEIPHGKAAMMYDSITLEELLPVAEHIVAKVNVNDLNLLGTIR